jgi:GH25 family lysozyme M1 (1,4-beta-N-acetylmuramidase)
MTALGIDVSHWQSETAPIAWPVVKAAGIAFAIAKATEGTGYVDPAYRVNAAGMRAVGLLPGAYHWLVPTAGAAQADHFSRTIGDPTGMLVALDIEEAGVTAADVDAFVARWRQLHSGHPVLMYGSRYNELGDSATSADGPLWLADYGANPVGSPASAYAARGGDASTKWGWGAAFNGWAGALIWQFSSNGSVAGIAARVDLNACKAGADALRALTGEPMKIEFKIEHWTLDGIPGYEITSVGAPYKADGVTVDYNAGRYCYSIDPPTLTLVARNRLTNPREDLNEEFKAALHAYALPDLAPVQAQLDAANAQVVAAQAVIGETQVALQTARAEAQAAALDALAQMARLEADMAAMQAAQVEALAAARVEQYETDLRNAHIALGDRPAA